jgi:hypothetical protein
MDAAVNQANNTTVWLFLAFFVFAPILLLFATVIAVGIKQRALKCPKCGNWRKNKSAIQTVRTVEGSKATVTTQRVVICRKCKNEFTV